MGSSIGVSKVAKASELEPAVKHALEFDTKVLIEKAIVGDEVECAILGNENPKASVVGRVIPKGGFYSYEKKYFDDKGAVLEIPAKITKQVKEQSQQVALEAYKALCCEGMTRVDMFSTKDGEIIVNEVNTLPGFTKNSMYPKLWEMAGISYTELLTMLIELAIARFKQRQALKSSY